MADDDASWDELIEQAQALLEQEKPRKRKLGESEFEFYRDSVSGHRISKQNIVRVLESHQRFHNQRLVAVLKV